MDRLQERLQLAELEYQRGRAKLKSTAGELESLASRVRGSSKAAKREFARRCCCGCGHGAARWVQAAQEAWGPACS